MADLPPLSPLATAFPGVSDDDLAKYAEIEAKGEKRPSVLQNIERERLSRLREAHGKEMRQADEARAEEGKKAAVRIEKHVKKPKGKTA